eukprot:1334322-Amorphochlora_amoeboformis.AAC.1
MADVTSWSLRLFHSRLRAILRSRMSYTFISHPLDCVLTRVGLGRGMGSGGGGRGPRWGKPGPKGWVRISMGFGSIVCGLVCGTVALSDKDSSSLIPNPDSKVSNRAIHPPRCAESVGDGSNGNSHPYQPDVSWIDIYSNELKPHPHRVGGHPIYTYPDAYKPRPHLATESGTAATGRRMHTILKPKIKGVRGRRELEFYTTVANYPLLKAVFRARSRSDLCRQDQRRQGIALKKERTKLFPLTFLFSSAEPAGYTKAEGCEFLELQDLTQGFSLPVIIDIKIGRSATSRSIVANLMRRDMFHSFFHNRRTWGPDATAAKIRSAKT